MEIYAVTGKPIAFSLSPQLYNLAFCRMRYPAVYTRLAADTAGDALLMAREIGLRGLNVTAPFKEAMAALMDHLHSAAFQLQAVNTVLLKKGKALGFNTDPDGVLGAFYYHKIKLQGENALILGAGGAGRAAALALLEAGARVTLVNRTLTRARLAAGKLGCTYCPLVKLPEVLSRTRIIVSAVSGNLGLIQPDWLDSGHILLDADYRDSTLARLAREKGCKIIPGTDWLLFQAVAALKVFTGREVELRRIHQTLSLPDPDSRTRKTASDLSFSLIGMMGAGKSTIGEKLAAALSLPFADADRAIERTAGQQIPSLFRDRGERAFRRLESRIIKRMGRERRKMVYALGGGAVGLESNRKIMKARSRVIWLWANPRTLLSRVQRGGRPLLEGKDRLGKLRLILAERLPSYAAASDLIVNAESPPAKIIRKILHEIY
jgi:shikimate dehydrogenase